MGTKIPLDTGCRLWSVLEVHRGDGASTVAAIYQPNCEQRSPSHSSGRRPSCEQLQSRLPDRSGVCCAPPDGRGADPGARMALGGPHSVDRFDPHPLALSIIELCSDRTHSRAPPGRSLDLFGALVSNVWALVPPPRAAFEATVSGQDWDRAGAARLYANGCRQELSDVPPMAS
jgi:hypothetical protein